MVLSKIKLSVIIVTKNEEKNLPDCLKSVSFADEIIVIDSYSKDKTVKIAKEFGCKVFIESWKGYGPQKQSALEKTSNRWVLSIDADERIPPETGNIIKEILQFPKAAAYSFPRRNYFHGKWIKGCGWWPDRVVRLFDKYSGNFNGIVHESWQTRGKIIHLNVPIEHYTCRTYSHLLQKMAIYSSLTAKELYKKNKRVSLFSPVIHSFWMFIKSYFLKAGFMDGFDGLVISLINAAGSFFKYAKLLELQKYGEIDCNDEENNFR